MKRFFTKKSVASILIFTLLSGFFISNFAFANTAAVAPEATTTNAVNYDIWSKVGGTFGSIANVAVGIYNTPQVAGWAINLKAVEGIEGVCVALAGFLFDKAIDFSINNMATLFNSGGILNSIWTMVRDTINIFFIFILLYIAITKIIGSWGVKSKTSLVNVIIDVIFINFSMFITKMIIDAGNLVAVVIYKQLQTIAAGSIAGVIIGQLNIKGFIVNIFTATGQTNMLIILILQIALIGVLIWVYFYVTFLFIGRTVMLFFLALSSPIGFVFGSIPWISEHAKAWWKTLVDQIMVAPVFMFFLYVLMRLMENGNLLAITQAKIDNSNILAGLKPPPLDVSGYFYYIFMITLMFVGINLTKKISGKVGEWTVKIAGGLAATGTVAVAGGIAMSALNLGALSEGLSAANGAGGLLSKEGMSAGVNAAKQRLGTGFKNITNVAGKFASGKLQEETGGVKGFAIGIARDKILGGIKNTTGSIVDIDKFTKGLDKSQKKNEENIIKQIDAVGPQKYIERQQQIENIKNNFTDQASNKLLANSQEKKDRDVAEANLKQKQENAEKAGPNITPQIKKDLEDAKINLDQADEKIKKFFDENKHKIENEAKEMAKSIGKDFDKLDEEYKELGPKIIEATEARNKAIYGLANGSFYETMLFGEERDKLVNKLWAQKNRYISEDEKFMNRLKDFIKEKNKNENEEKKEKEKIKKEMKP